MKPATSPAALVPPTSDLPTSAAIHPAGSSDRPSISRLVEATLREDWTASELAQLRQWPESAELLQRALRKLWRPSARQLFLYRQGRLDGDEANDVDYHLSIDRSAAAWRLAEALQTDAGLQLMASLSPGRLVSALDSVVTTAQQFQLFPAEANGPVCLGPVWRQSLTLDDLDTSAELIRDASVTTLHLNRVATSVMPVVARVSLANCQGRALSTSYLALHREGSRALGSMELAVEPREACQPIVRWIRAGDVAFEPTVALRAAWKKQTRHTQAACVAWQRWAAAARNLRWRAERGPFSGQGRYQDLDRWLCEIAEQA